MNIVRTIATVALIGLCGCAPEVGSKAWCEDLAEKSKGDWTVNESMEYAKSCIIRTDDD